MNDEVYEIELRAVVKVTYPVKAPTLERAKEILDYDLENGRKDILRDGRLEDWEIWNIE